MVIIHDHPKTRHPLLRTAIAGEILELQKARAAAHDPFKRRELDVKIKRLFALLQRVVTAALLLLAVVPMHASAQSTIVGDEAPRRAPTEETNGLLGWASGQGGRNPGQEKPGVARGVEKLIILILVLILAHERSGPRPRSRRAAHSPLLGEEMLAFRGRPPGMSLRRIAGRGARGRGVASAFARLGREQALLVKYGGAGCGIGRIEYSFSPKAVDAGALGEKLGK
jgi:hypothetical protein